MAEFLYLYRGGEPASSPQEQQEITARWRAWLQSLGEKGHVVSPGQALERSGRIVQPRGTMITDGPFAETKEVIGGFSLIRAGDIAEATELAKSCPILERGGEVEVRPVRPVIL